jgi:hypothetical protein
LSNALNQAFSGSETASINHLSLFGERSLMARDIAKINADRHLNPGLSAWNFRDGVIRWHFHGDRFSDPNTCSGVPLLRLSSGLLTNQPFPNPT